MIQIATVLGARVSAVASTPARRDLAARAGAEHVLTPQEWFAAVRGDGGADVIIDPVGGEVFEASVRCLAPEGRLVTVGFTSGTIPRAAANRLLLRNASVVGAAWRELLTLHPCLFADTAARLADLVRAGLRPLIGVRYPLTDGPAALAGIQTRDVVGKVVLDLE